MISVIVPVYNVELFLSECIDSLLNQTYKDFEVILVDDGSSDGSKEICELYAQKDTRLHYIHQENAGVSAARNVALEVVKGEYVCFVDADDVVAPDYLNHLFFLSKDGDFPVCGYTKDINLLGQKSDRTAKYEARDYITRVLFETVDHPNLWMMLFKNRIIQDNKLRFDEGCFRNEDTDFFIHYLLYEKIVKVSNYKAYFYRSNPDSIMRRPVSIKSLTSIEASHRMNELMVEKGVISDSEILLSNGVLKYVYATARQKNKNLYEYLHNYYNVRAAMKKMLAFPRLSKKMVALSYLLLGEDLFYKFVRTLSIFY